MSFFVFISNNTFCLLFLSSQSFGLRVSLWKAVRLQRFDNYEDIFPLIELNCRMGDPETQPIMARLQSDLVSICRATLDGTLAVDAYLPGAQQLLQAPEGQVGVMALEPTVEAHIRFVRRHGFCGYTTHCNTARTSQIPANSARIEPSTDAPA